MYSTLVLSTGKKVTLHFLYHAVRVYRKLLENAETGKTVEIPRFHGGSNNVYYTHDECREIMLYVQANWNVLGNVN